MADAELAAAAAAMQALSSSGSDPAASDTDADDGASFDADDGHSPNLAPALADAEPA